MGSTESPVTILPTEYRPKALDEFYGPARIAARRITNSARMCLPSNAPAAHLIVGKTGVGKTAIATFAMEAFGVQPWCLTEVFGADMTLERAKEIWWDMQSTNLFGGYRGWLFDEFDKCTPGARDRCLQYVGEQRQPRNTVIIATSNMSLAEFDALEKIEGARGRLTSRFQVHELEGPNAVEAAALAARWIDAESARNIANLAATDGEGKASPVNVRSLLKDITTHLQQ